VAEPLAGARGNVSYADHACDCLLSVHVRNTGKMPAAETVLFRHSIWTSRAVRWTRSLSGFGRVQLKPSEGRRVEATVTARELAIWKEDGWLVEGGEYRVDACSSAIDCRANLNMLNS